MRISDWSSDVCSSDLDRPAGLQGQGQGLLVAGLEDTADGNLAQAVIAQAELDVGIAVHFHQHGLQRPSLDDEAAFGPAASAGQSGFGDVLQLAEAGGLDRDALAWRQRCHLLLFPVLCGNRSEEHTSELQSLMRTSYAVFCLKKK